MARAKLEVQFRHPDGSVRRVYGREALTLIQLVENGTRGLSGLECGGVRLSAYIFDLRHEFGIGIQTETELHAGMFAGHHARYKLTTPVKIVWRSDLDAPDTHARAAA